MEFSHITTDKLHFWPKNVLRTVLVSAKDFLTRLPRTKNKFFSDKSPFELFQLCYLDPMLLAMFRYVPDNFCPNIKKSAFRGSKFNFEPILRLDGQTKDIHKAL